MYIWNYQGSHLRYRQGKKQTLQHTICYSNNLLLNKLLSWRYFGYKHLIDCLMKIYYGLTEIKYVVH